MDEKTREFLKQRFIAVSETELAMFIYCEKQGMAHNFITEFVEGDEKSYDIRANRTHLIDIIFGFEKDNPIKKEVEEVAKNSYRPPSEKQSAEFSGKPFLYFQAIQNKEEFDNCKPYLEDTIANIMSLCRGAILKQAEKEIDGIFISPRESEYEYSQH